MYALYAFIYFSITSRMTKAAKSYDNFLSHVSKREIVHTMEGKSTLALKVRDSDRGRERGREKRARENSDR